jgi:glycosyltransferase involved in cell wall biosynthesis
MKIGIDARLWNETGVGRYIRALTEELPRLDTQNEYTLFLRHSEYESVILPNERWRKVLADVPWHTLDEQLKMPGIFDREGLDLLHIPYFSVPMRLKTPFIVTIHDLIISHFATGLATTRTLPIYWLKRLGYNFVLSAAIKNSIAVVTVSQTVKQQLVVEFNVPAEKIMVTYEGGRLEKAVTQPKVTLPSRYILYVGNAHPHKNLAKLIDGFILLKKKFPDLKLVLIGKEDFFYERLEAQVQKLSLGDSVIFTGFVPSDALAIWYRGAQVFVFPSREEGFGIPGLEAMSQGVSVAASNIPVFHEIYADCALYFDCQNPDAIAENIGKLLEDKALRQSLVMRGKIRVAQFSWTQMAKETLHLYENRLRLRSHQ